MHKYLFKIEKTSFKRIFIFFTTIVILFALAYRYLPLEYGELKFSYDSKIIPDIWDCLYFSVVTISSLGFGDYYPLGWMRLLVGIQVLIGLLFLGVLVAKIASEKSSYYLKRLYSAQVHDRIVSFTEGFNNIFTEYQIIVEEGTYDARLLSPKNENLYEDLLSITISMRKYMGYEVYFGEFFFDISKSSMHGPLDKIIEILDYLNKTVTAELIGTNSNRKRVLKTAQMYITVCNMIKKYSNTSTLHKKSNEIIKRSTKLRDNLHVMEIPR